LDADTLTDDAPGSGQRFNMGAFGTPLRLVQKPSPSRCAASNVVAQIPMSRFLPPSLEKHRTVGIQRLEVLIGSVRNPVETSSTITAKSLASFR
jgi:hypothetical protein